MRLSRSNSAALMCRWHIAASYKRCVLLTAKQNFLQRLDRGAKRALQAARLLLEQRRHDRLFGPLPRQEIPAPTGLDVQTETLSDVVRKHCSLGTQIATAHATAAMKLDAAEYAFSSMLDEIRGSMTILPTAWTPDRVLQTADLPTSEARQAQAA
jgi:hypothetical protein